MLAGMKRSLFEEDVPFGHTVKRLRFSPRKAAEDQQFSLDLQSLQKQHPSVTPGLISTILETCNNNPQDASVSLSLVEVGSSPDVRSPSGKSSGDPSSSSSPDPVDDYSSLSSPGLSADDLRLIAERLASSIRSAESAEKGFALSESFVKKLIGLVASSDGRAQRNLEATKVLLRSLHQMNSKAHRNRDAAITEINRLKEALRISELRAQNAEHTVELLRWHLDQFAKSSFSPFGGGPADGGVF